MPATEIYWLIVAFVVGCSAVFGLLYLALRDIAGDLDGRIEAVTSLEPNPRTERRIPEPSGGGTPCRTAAARVSVRGKAHQRRIARRAEQRASKLGAV